MLKSCILVFDYGGPSHLDTYDLKPNAPAEVRGEFQPISTTVPGLHICEHLPKMSQQMHRVALVRSVTHQARLRQIKGVGFKWHCRGRNCRYAFALPDSSLFFRTWRGSCISL